MAETIEFKQQMKEALYEFFKDDNEFLRDIISNIMEEIALGKAIEKGDIGDYVDEGTIIAQLGKAN